MSPIGSPAQVECSLGGCPYTRPHYHRGDDEIVWTGPPVPAPPYENGGPLLPLDPPSGSITPPRMSVNPRPRAGRLMPPSDGIAPRPFFLLRFTDVSGVSGEGVVAYGVRFQSGKVALEWCVPGLPSSVGVWDSLADVQKIHGHGNNTVVRWLDGGGDDD